MNVFLISHPSCGRKAKVMVLDKPTQFADTSEGALALSSLFNVFNVFTYKVT